jgi:hypothetical protein
MNEHLTVLGAATAIGGGWTILLLTAYLLTLLSNRLMHLLLDCYGGWKVFLQFRKWYFENKRDEVTK